MRTNFAACRWLLDRAPGRLATALRLALGEDEQVS
jgi:hypothetical protein